MAEKEDLAIFAIFAISFFIVFSELNFFSVFYCVSHFFPTFAICSTVFHTEHLAAFNHCKSKLRPALLNMKET